MTAPKVTVLRGVDATAADLSTVRARIARDLVIDPALVRDATDEGYRTGYNAGFTAGLEDAATAIDAREEQRRGELRSVVQRLATAIDELDGRHRDVITDIESRVVAVACEIAEAIVGHELAASEQPGRDAIARCLQLAPVDGTVIAHLHPDDVATAAIDDLTATYGRAIRIVADATLTPGDAIVDVGPTRIDGRIATALARVREVLAQ
ncbi:MAG TPA: FliH/SctL family protein [Acidimicrobiia bacterium]